MDTAHGRSMTVADTSIIAYDQHKASGKLTTQAQHIFDCMQFNRDYSRRELMSVTGLEINAICGRVNELVAKGALCVGNSRKCSITNKLIQPIYKKGLFL